MQPTYLTLTCRLPAPAEERLADLLQGWPVLGCQVEDAGTEVAVVVYMSEAERGALATVREGLAALGARSLETAPFADHDWLAEYRRQVIAQPVGRSFWIDPHPARPTPPPPGRHHLVIEPRQAFGTGSHESTRLVLLLLEDDPPVGRSVLDVGTGSGILAIAARGLGATRVVGFDIDPEAVFVARQTVAAQPRACRVALVCGGAAMLRPAPVFDMVLANMLPSQFTPLLPALRAVVADRGALLLSGLMVDQKQAVAEELSRLELAVERWREQGEWAALVARRS